MNRRTMMISTALLTLTGFGAAAGVYASKEPQHPLAASNDRRPIDGAKVAENKPAATLYRNPNCDCCLEYAKYLRGKGFDVTVDAKEDLAEVRKKLKVPENLEGCHVMVIGRYAVEGHVPVDVLNKLLTEKPNIIGISLPGMPTGTPGMTGPKRAPFTIYEIRNDGEPAKVFAVV